MGLAFYRELFQQFLSYEDVDQTLNRKGDFRCVGKVVAQQFDNKTHEIDFYINYAASPEDNQASFSQFKDGTFGIVFSKSLFVKTPLNRLMAIIAHEVGHYLCDHLTKPSYGTQLNIDYDRLVKLATKAGKKNCTKADTRDYLRAVMFSLLRGGMVLREMEADRYASFFVSVESLIAIHSEDLSHKNPFCSLEKRNRLVWLNTLAESETEEKLHLELVLNKAKPKVENTPVESLHLDDKQISYRYP